MSDDQCLEFISIIDYNKMSIKPTVSSSLYWIDGILKLRIIFAVEIKTKILSTCNSIFDESTVKALGSNAQCTWTSTKILDVIYTATTSLITNVTLRGNSIFYNYKYAANPADIQTLYPLLPDISDSISINSVSTAPRCKSLILTAVTKVIGVFEYTYSWELSYPSGLSNSTIQTNFEALATQDSQMLTVSSDNLLEEKNLQVLLTVHVSLLNTDISVVKNIYITAILPVLSFSSSEVYELTLIGNKTNDLGLIINSDPCNTGSSSDTEVTFSVYSGTIVTDINTHSSTETSIEEKLLSDYLLYRTVQANINVGFQYNHYYNLTVCASFTGYTLQSCHN